MGLRDGRLLRTGDWGLGTGRTRRRGGPATIYGRVRAEVANITGRRQHQPPISSRALDALRVRETGHLEAEPGVLLLHPG